MDLFFDHEATTAIAVPKLMPELVTMVLVDSLLLANKGKQIVINSILKQIFFIVFGF
jgi:hypothetical protein